MRISQSQIRTFRSIYFNKKNRRYNQLNAIQQTKTNAIQVYYKVKRIIFSARRINKFAQSCNRKKKISMIL